MQATSIEALGYGYDGIHLGSAKHWDSLEHSMQIAIRDDGSVILVSLFVQNWLFINVNNDSQSNSHPCSQCWDQVGVKSRIFFFDRSSFMNKKMIHRRKSDKQEEDNTGKSNSQHNWMVTCTRCG